MKIKGRIAGMNIETERPHGLRQGEIEETYLEKIFVNPDDLPKNCWGYNAVLKEAARLDGMADGVNDAEYGHESINVYFDKIDIEIEEGTPDKDWIAWSTVTKTYVKRSFPDESQREEIFYE